MKYIKPDLKIVDLIHKKSILALSFYGSTEPEVSNYLETPTEEDEEEGW